HSCFFEWMNCNIFACFGFSSVDPKMLIPEDIAGNFVTDFRFFEWLPIDLQMGHQFGLFTSRCLFRLHEMERKTLSMHMIVLLTSSMLAFSMCAFTDRHLFNLHRMQIFRIHMDLDMEQAVMVKRCFSRTGAVLFIDGV